MTTRKFELGYSKIQKKTKFQALIASQKNKFI